MREERCVHILRSSLRSRQADGSLGSTSSLLDWDVIFRRTCTQNEWQSNTWDADGEVRVDLIGHRGTTSSWLEVMLSRSHEGGKSNGGVCVSAGQGPGIVAGWGGGEGLDIGRTS